jgi:cytochrome c peroxidase
MRTASWAVLAALAVAGCGGDPPITPARLGALVFADPDLSSPPGQACTDCHAANVAFRDPESDAATSMGVVRGRFGPRNAPTAMYARSIPPLHRDAAGQWYGGLFWDGRAATLEAQAESPLLDPLEMNNPDKAAVVASVRRARYADQFRKLYGPHALDDTDAAFARIVGVIAAYERTSTFAPFSSKYDRYLAGEATLTDAEQRGLAIFEDPARGDCARCHPSRPGPDGAPPMFTTYGYANLGLPAYPNNGFYQQPPPYNPDGAHYIDHGLMETVGDPRQDGMFRIPTLRNIARTGPYGHDGYFENLPDFLDFLNTRDVGSYDVGTCERPPGAHVRCAWPPPEVAATVTPGRIGHLGLSDAELADLFAFLRTLTDARPAPAR